MTRRLAGKLRGALADTRPLNTLEFRRLWTAGVVTTIGAQMTVVAVPVQIYTLTQSSAYVGLTGLFGLVPLVVFGLWGGAIADAMDRRTLLLASGAGISLMSLALWVVSASGVGSVWLVLCLFAVQQGLLAINQPTRSAVLPRILPNAQLPAANALNMTVFQFGAIVGPVLAGALIPVIGLSTLYLADAIALLATLWATWRLPKMPPSTTENGTRPTAGLRDVLAGFRYVATQKILLVSFLVDIIAMALGMPRAVFPEMAERTFHDPPGGGIALGLLYASIAIGAVAGGLFSGWLHRIRRQGVAVTVAICVWGLGVTVFGLTDLLWLAVLALAVAGAADLVSAVFRSTMLQVVATDEMRGRMQGVFIVVVAGGPRLADIWHGPAADVVGTGTAAAGGGLAVILATVVTVALLPAFWRYRAPVR
ncbi:MAG TPA: MFS transporter [Pseudonocardia sp.]|uniref:MFS transporter n=1 Tax=Pseudonocardia sp. TaxID=60912 RepID=UPI002B7D6749|nr:MFS transporter [Pseudonocardia sp.]HTF47019.1 MFS transporter [Pseudonocardia sp.]